jgi:adenylate kinase
VLEMKILVLGAPGSGKGTYSRGLSEILKIPHISSGELLRSLRDDAEVGKTIREYQDKGLVVPDEIVMPLLEKRLNQDDCKNGFILDGITYNINQAEMLEKITDIELVINLVLPDEILIKKNLGRRTCKKCGSSSYNLVEINEGGINMPALLPKKEGICDKCGGPLFIRSDDTEEVMRERLRVYWERIKPVLKFYRDKGLVRDFKVNSSPDVMIPKLLKLIKTELKC